MDHETLEQIAKRLDGTDDGITELLAKMGLDDIDPFQAEAELERKLSFGYCLECELWSDGTRNGQCDLCRS